VTTFACDLAISSVSSDAGLVAELRTELALRLSLATLSLDLASDDVDPNARFDASHSRMVLVLHSELWAHDAQSRGHAALLEQRIRERPGSICVIVLDDTTVPKWLAKAPRYDLTASGRTGSVDFVLKAVATAGATIKQSAKSDAITNPNPSWDRPTPFLGQPRAQSALRQEFEAIAEQLEAEVERSRAAQPDCLHEVHVLPNRVVARMNDHAITVSWISGRQPTVADGRLLVIAWRDVALGVKGVPALKSAKPVRERTYAAGGNSHDEWCWRVEDATDIPYSSINLAADWIARSGLDQVA
jgi:hypothetical protein